MVNSTDSGADGGDELDLAHLHEAARRIARLADDERLRYVRADRWIGYPAPPRRWTGWKRCWHGRTSSGCLTCC